MDKFYLQTARTTVTATDNRPCVLIFWAEPQHVQLMAQFTNALNVILRLHLGNEHSKFKSAFAKNIHMHVFIDGNDVIEVPKLFANMLQIMVVVREGSPPDMKYGDDTYVMPRCKIIIKIKPSRNPQPIDYYKSAAAIRTNSLSFSTNNNDGAAAASETPKTADSLRRYTDYICPKQS